MDPYQTIAKKIYKLFCDARRAKRLAQMYAQEEVMTFNRPYYDYRLDKLIEFEEDNWK